MSDIEGIGMAGEVVKVADGYARNYLLPKNLAAPLTDATRKKLETVRRQRLEKEGRRLAEAQNMVASIEKVSCTIPVKIGEDGQLYGSVTAAEIVATLKEQGLELDRRQIHLKEPIRELGVFQVPVKPHADVNATLKVWVVEE